ncbi:MAG: AAA family ATPase [Desulfobacterales bacterium]|jgi:pilus assembly protein CpaE
MQNQMLTIKLMLRSHQLRQQMDAILRSLGGFEVLQERDTRKPDLLFFELGPNAEKEMAMIESLLKANEVGAVFLTAEHAEPTVLMRAIRLGAREFFPQPIKVDEVKQALQTFKEQPKESTSKAEDKSGKIISVLGSKGGVGTTTVAVNLAMSLLQPKKGKSVVLVDMNTLFGEVPLFLEMSPKFHWGEITKNIDRLDNTFLANVLTQHQSGIHVLPSPAYLNGHVRPTPEIMSRLLGLMKRMFDYVLIDTGQSTNDTSLRVVELSDTLMLVTIQSLPCLANTNRLIKSFLDLGYAEDDRIKIILNRYTKNSDLSMKDAEAGIKRELFWVIPNDYSTTMSAINKGKPLAQIASRAAITKSFEELARALHPTESQPEERKWRIFKR